MENKNYELKLIGAGLPRTGTMSTKAALEILGFKSYHMMENVKNGHSNQWVDIYQNKNKEKNFNIVFKDFNATVDAPGCFHWEELLKNNPNAKVLLSVRDDPEGWHRSCAETVYKHIDPKQREFGFRVCLFFIPMIRSFKYLLNQLDEKFNKDYSLEASIKMYNKHTSEVIEKCPKDKLLVWNVKEGWEPLCKFLNVPVPDQPFPRINDTAEFKNRDKMFTRVAYALLLIISGLVIGAAYLLKKNIFA